MKVLILVGLLALAAAQTAKDQSLGNSPTPDPVTRQPNEDVPIDSKLQDFLFGTPKTPNRGGSLDEELLVTLSTLLCGSVYERIRWAFHLYDLPGNGAVEGAISRQELAEVLVAVRDLLGRRAPTGSPASSVDDAKANEQITVKPTDHPSTFFDKDGLPCQCVPYYLCDANNVNNVTEYGVLDIKFDKDNNSINRYCQESVEVCCAIPKDPTEEPKPPKPQPKPEPVKGCGIRNPQGLGVTLFGAFDADSQFGEFPWVVAVLDNQNYTYAGVGVLIHPQVVMTAAHIVENFGPGSLKIRAGEWDTQTIKEIFPHEERVVENIVIHENFQPKNLKNDIALLRLDRPVDISENINIICMPEYEEVFDSSKNCVANGWGKNNFGNSNAYSVILKKVEVDMVPHRQCNTLLKRTRLGYNFKLHNSFVCAGGEVGKDTCQGDGGAPLACPIGNDRYKLTGLVASGIGCGQQNVPAVYTNVPLFRKWVDDKMADWGLTVTSYRI